VGYCAPGGLVDEVESFPGSPKYDGGHRCRNRIVGSSLALVALSRALPGLAISLPTPNGFLLCKSLSSTSSPPPLTAVIVRLSCHVSPILPGVSLTIQAEICIATPWTLPAKALLAHS